MPTIAHEEVKAIVSKLKDAHIYNGVTPNEGQEKQLVIQLWPEISNIVYREQNKIVKETNMHHLYSLARALPENYFDEIVKVLGIELV